VIFFRGDMPRKTKTAAPEIKQDLSGGKDGDWDADTWRVVT
jgi:hypothetical protein